MSYWDTVIQSNPYQLALRQKDQPNAYAAIYPTYEVTTPQYPAPNPYSLAVRGYRSNELVFACIQKRMDAVCEPPMLVYDATGDTPELLEDSPLRALIVKPCEGVTEKGFWQISELNLLSAGFAAWEMERNNGGEVIALWPMRPDWCSFLRGAGRPLRAIRYQPYGLPPQEIDRDNILLFQYFDPIYPLLKGLAPVTVALRTVDVDNNATDFLNVFFRQGSVITGLLSSDQSLSDVEAERIRRRWGEVHGSAENWGTNNIAVLGAGSKYQSIGMNFRDMAFEELDGRDEARICMTLKVPPILIGAKVGLRASTYSNYEQAREAFYEETISPQWSMYKAEIDKQLKPLFHGDSPKIYAAFDTKNVRALQEDKDKAWTRAKEAARFNIVTRDEAREEMGLEPIDNEPVFVGPVKAVIPGVAGVDPGQEDTNGNQTDETTKAARDLERRQFHVYAAKRKKEGKAASIKDFKFNFLDAGEQAALMTEIPGSAWRNYP